MIFEREKIAAKIYVDQKLPKVMSFYYSSSVTRLGNLLHFGQLFKSCGNNYFAKMAHIFRQFL